MCASLLALSSAGTGTAAALPLQVDKHSAKQNPKTVVEVKKQDQEKIYLPDEKVRVIVEMKEEPAIEYAKKQGKRFKDLDKNTKNKLQSDKKAGHKKVKDKAKAKKVEFKELESFTTVVNGFSVETEYKNIAALQSIEEVAAVHIANEYERPLEKPDMIYSKELVQAQEAWRDYGYKGEGMVVGVIDTGIDPSHRDMVLSEGVEEELSSAEVADSKAANGLRGKFYSEKVPYGYNYMDDNEEILDLGPDASMHGMHVAGTVGANGDEENHGIKGVAPEAQLLALKVFGNDPNMPSTWGDIYVKAIDEAIILGADVLNMSLGSTAGFVRPEDPEQAAVQRAVDNGILMSISAGNSAHFGNGFANPLASNPDIGVSGSPGVSFNSLQVASVENNFMDLDGANYTASGGLTGIAPFLSASSVHPNDLEQKTYDVVYAGLGKPEELAAANVQGKIALIKRGEIGFVDKTKNAQAAGAAAVIIYNNTSGYVSMASEPSITIPQLFMLKSDGDKLQATLTGGQTVSISFNGAKAKSANPEAGKMSAFTSWGMTPNLDFKPEITAPGGQIYSTLNNNEYGMMSGTSMAAPHVAGGSALVLQRVEKDFKVDGLEKVNLTKNLLMNTASPLIDKGTVNTAFGWKLPYSPRRQGAGVMQLHAALETPVVVTASNTNEGKVALKEVGDQFSFTLKAQNFSGTDAQYDVAANIQTDFAIEGQLGYTANVLETQKILDAVVKVNGESSKVITVPANGSVTFEVTVDVSQAKVVEPAITGSWTTPVDINKVFPNGYFVEGYVTLKDVNDDGTEDGTDPNPELHVPYAGFKGEWDKAPVLDGTIYDSESFYGMAGAVSKSADTYNYLGYNPVADSYNGQYIAISPNGDGVQDELIPVLSFLRNAKQVEFNVLDKDSKAVRKLRTEYELRKNYYDGGRSAKYSLDPARQWDGKINNLVAKDGQYYFETKAAVDFEGADFQSFKIPVLVDTVKPTVTAKKDATGRKLTIQAADTTGGAGVSYLDILVDGNSILTAPLAPTTTEFNLPDTVKAEAKVEVVAVDYAGNFAVTNAIPEDKTIPSVFVNDPEALSTYKTKTVPVNGYIIEPSGLKEFTIAGKPVALTYNEAKGQYEFSTTLTLEDGVHSFEVKAVDNAGNAIAFKRTVIVDSTAPVLSITGLPKKNTVGAKDPNPKVDVKVTDNFDEIRLFLNGSEIFYQPFKEPYAMRAFSKVIEDVELPLVKGANNFTFEVTDLAGNKTTKTVTITKR